MKREAGVEVRISQLQTLLSTKECPTCGQDLGEDRRAQIGADLGRLEGELAQFKDHSDALQRLSASLEALHKIRGVSARDRIARIDHDLHGHGDVVWRGALVRRRQRPSLLPAQFAHHDSPTPFGRRRALWPGHRH